MSLKKLIASLEQHVADPSQGLPEELFLFVSRITPLVNVDLLIKNDYDQTLLTWRDDGFFPAGWHVPGGIVRYKETLSERLKAVAANEIGSRIEFLPEPLQINEVIVPELINRGHAFSYLYRCRLTSPPDSKLEYKEGIPQSGEWAWHDGCPEDFMSVQSMYCKYI